MTSRYTPPVRRVNAGRGHCSVDECSRLPHARGWCHAHYMRFRRHGDPAFSLINRNHDGACSVDGCQRVYRSNGLCFMHWQRMRKHGDAGGAEPLHAHYPTGSTCSVDGCDTRPRRNWLCEMHADRLDDHGDVGEPGRRRKVAGAGYVRADGYIEVRIPEDHQLSRGGRTLLHRIVLWEAIGPGPHTCRWCDRVVLWTYGLPEDALVVDHVDRDTTNNARSNLVPSCSPCNIGRRSAA